MEGDCEGVQIETKPNPDMKKITKKESDILTLLKVFSMIGVVLIHTPKPDYPTFVSTFFDNLTMSCVPIFFLLSGFFLMRKKIETKTIAILEIRKRINTLLIPFVFWNTLTLLTSITFFYFVPNLSNGGAGTISDFSFTTIMSAFWGIGRLPIHYQFWFIRNLMIIVLLAPFLKFLLNRAPWFGLAVAFFLNQWLLDGTIYFYIGGIMAVYGSSDLFVMKKSGIYIASSLAIMLLALWTEVPHLVILLTSFILIISLANLSELKVGPLSRGDTLPNYIFFVYATHEPLITFTDRLLYKAFGIPIFVQYFKFVALPIFAVLLTWALGFLMKKYVTKVYNLSTGAR